MLTDSLIFTLYAELQQQPALGHHGQTITENYLYIVYYDAWQRAESLSSSEQAKDRGVHSEYGAWKLTSSQPCQNKPRPIPSTSEHQHLFFNGDNNPDYPCSPSEKLPETP